MDVQARWAPTGLHVRLMVHHDGDHDLDEVGLVVRTEGGVPCRLLPGKRAPSVPVDLTRIPANGSIWMNVEPLGPVDGPVSALEVEVHVGRTLVCQVVVPIVGGDD